MSGTIRVRACLAVVHNERILLVPHYNTDVGPVQWVIPGGSVEFGEELAQAAAREFTEETGVRVRVGELLDVSEVPLPERPWHSITITFTGEVEGGKLAAEANHAYGRKMPRWFTWEEMAGLAYHQGRRSERPLEGCKSSMSTRGEGRTG